jgi:CRP-like cAMP-binding protein
MLDTRLRLVFDGLADAILLSLGQRCARALLHAMDALGEHADDGTVTMHLTQGEVAGMLGNARPVVNRVLVEFQRSGIIDLGYRRIVVLKPDALRAAQG